MTLSRNLKGWRIIFPYDLCLTDEKNITSTAALRKEHTGISITFILLCIYVIIKYAFVACIIKGQNIW